MEELRKNGLHYNITLVKNNKCKYDFVNYSTATKIGVIDRNTSFLDFVEEFKKDVKALLKEVDDDYDIGLALLRVTPSKYSFGILPKEEIEDIENVKIKNLDIARIIAILAKNHTTTSEKAIISTFDKNINLLEIINQLSILDLIHLKEDISDNYKRFLKSDDLKKSLTKSLKAMEITTFKELAVAIKKDYVGKRKMLKIFRECYIK